MENKFTQLKYRAELDGLRACAVLSVIFYHLDINYAGLDLDLFSGGFIGVDVFFVISGYLISRLLFEEIETKRKINIGYFFERRARRLVPTLIIVISFSIVFAYFRLLPHALEEFGRSAVASLFFVSNIFFYFEMTEYGAESALLKPLLHTWSLAVEEQFYIFAPLLILLIYKLNALWKFGVLIALIFASFIAGLIANHYEPNLAFYFPIFRFWEILFGVLTFMVGKYLRIDCLQPHQTTICCACLLSIFTYCMFISGTSFQSVFLKLVPVLSTSLLILYLTPKNLFGKILSIGPLVGIGRISYSLYLWHFPVFAYSRASNPMPSDKDKLEWALITLTLSIITYFIIEKPFRNRAIIPPKLFTLITVVSCVFLVTASVYILNGKINREIPKLLASENFKQKPWLNLKSENGEPCHNRRENFCTFKTSLEVTKPKIVSLGDSHSSTLSFDLYERIKKDFNYSEANIDGCPFVLDIKSNDYCNKNLQLTRARLIDETPSIIILSGRFPLYFSGEYFDNKEGGKEGGKFKSFESDRETDFLQSVKVTIKKLLDDGHFVIFIYPIPEVGFHVPGVIANSLQSGLVGAAKKLNSKKFSTSFDVYLARSKSTFQLIDSIEHERFRRILPHQKFCTDGIDLTNYSDRFRFKDLMKKYNKGHRCLTHDKNNIFYADDDHPSEKGAQMINDILIKELYNILETLNEES